MAKADKYALPAAPHPKAYDFLLKLRKRVDLTLKSNKFIRDSVRFRYYQTIGVVHLIKMSRMILGDGTGLGKTLEMIGAYAYLLASNPNLKMLIVAPKSATSQWVDEFYKFTEGIDVRRLENFGKASRAKQYEDFWTDPTRNVLVIHYHFFREDIRLYERYLDRDFVLVMDEVTAVKTHTSKTHLVAKEVSAKANRCIGLTATLLKNNLVEGYGIYKVILPSLFKNITSFKRWFCIEKMMKFNGKKIPQVVGYKNIPHFRRMIDPYFLGRNKYDVSDELPELVTKEVKCGLTPCQMDLYTSALEGLLEVRNVDGEMEEKETTALTKIGYCQQIVNSPHLIGVEGPSDKERELFRLLADEIKGEKIIIYSKYKKMVNRLEVLLHEKGINTCRITGDESEDQRNLNKLLFQEDMPALKRWVIANLGKDADPRVQKRVIRTCKTQLRKLKNRDFPEIILLTPAGTEALNLQAAAVFIFYDLPWSPGDYDQLLGRMIRIGSTKEAVLAIHMTCKGTVDDHVMRTLKAKSKIIKQVLGEQTKGALMFDKVSDMKDILSGLQADALRFRQGKTKMRQALRA